jgi:hypothetical protein
VALHTVTSWAPSSLGPVPNYVVLIINNLVLVLGNESGGPCHMQGRHTQDLGIGVKKLVVLTSSTHQMFN